MREIALRVEEPTVSINGQAFALRLSDVELFTRAQDVLDACARLGDVPVDAARVLAAARDVTGLLEEALGTGAAARISGGRPVSLPLAIEWLAALAQEAAAHCADEALAQDGACG